MPIIINQVKCRLKSEKQDIIDRALKIAHINYSDVAKAEIHKSSLDARKQNDIHFVHSIYCCMKDKSKEKSICEDNPQLAYVENSKLEFIKSTVKKDGRIVVAGFGPAGMFCGLCLAENGYKPLIIERGEDIDARTKSVQSFFGGDELNTSSNIQFGEGGAGTFSDGKLTCRTKDPLSRYILERFVEFGAPEEILFKAKPHIGTDKLRNIVKKIRERIIELGGEIRFSTCLEDFTLSNSGIDRVLFTGGEIKASALILSIGHSARDTFEMLANKNIFLEAKPFSVGARIEHLQSDVNNSLYGKYSDNPLLPQGEYQLSHRDKTGRGVYTFCMCPGGQVVPAASENGGIVTNGMSEFARDGINANSALVVSVTPKDFGNGALDGMHFARKIEQSAFKATGGLKAPATTVGGFLFGKPALSDKVNPTYARGCEAVDFKKIFPSFVISMMKVGLDQFSRKMQCFYDKSAMLTAPETRTSSPIRITRNEDMASLSCKNLYPCGEGAGYAGGIMSAAVDGLRTAITIMETQAP